MTDGVQSHAEGGSTILSVDDDANNLAVLVDFLGEHGFRTHGGSRRRDRGCGWLASTAPTWPSSTCTCPESMASRSVAG